MSKQKSTTPAAIEPAGQVSENGVALYGRFFPVKAEGMEGIKTTLSVTDDRGKALVIAAGSPGTLEIGESGVLRIVIVDVTAFWDEDTDEDTGEIKQFVRTCFYTKEGNTFRTSSPYAPHFVARILDLYGLQRLKEGIPITIRERVSRRERRKYHDFRVDFKPTGEVADETEGEIPF